MVRRERDHSDPQTADLPAELNTTGSEILSTVTAFGYAHIKQPVSSEDFESLSQQLGTIILRTDLAIDYERRSIVHKSEEIGFHADNPNIYIIGWYCVQQDALDGASRLLDTRDLVDFFSSDELKTLSAVQVRCPDLERHDPDRGREAYFYFPLLIDRGEGYDVYYAPWHLTGSYDREQSRALDKFKEYVAMKKESRAISIRLKEGESLFFSNRRMLHGRDAIQPDSRRLIKRVWIKQRA